MSEHIEDLLVHLDNLAKVIKAQGLDSEKAEELIPVLLTVCEAKRLVDSELSAGEGVCQCCGQKVPAATGFVKPTVRVRGYGDPLPGNPEYVEPIVVDTPTRRLAQKANEAEEEARRSADLSTYHALVRAAARRQAEATEADD